MAVRLRHGIFLAPFHKMNENPTLCSSGTCELIELLDGLGFHEAWIGEHHSAGFETIASPELFIAAAAERTKHIRFGTGVVSLPYHNPLMVANRIIQLDHMTRGRVMFGAGPGLLASDALMLGIEPEVQRDRMAEGLDVILRLFQGEVVTEKTDWYTLSRRRCTCCPTRRRTPRCASPAPSRRRAAAWRASTTSACCAWPPARAPASTRSTPTGGSRTRSRPRTAGGWTRAGCAGGQHAPGRHPGAGQGARALRASRSSRLLQQQHAADPHPRGRRPRRLGRRADNAVIGTPDDAIARIERLYEKQGEFGAVLLGAHNWADWEETKRSYELYARYVIPHFEGDNEPRQDPTSGSPSTRPSSPRSAAPRRRCSTSTRPNGHSAASRPRARSRARNPRSARPTGFSPGILQALAS